MTPTDDAAAARLDEVCACLAAACLAETGRGLALARHDTARALAGAARSLVGAEDVRVVTGFPVLSPDDALVGETDGPLGSALLAAALDTLGVEVRVVTDERCAPVVRAAVQAATHGSVVVDVLAARSGAVDEYAASARAGGCTHVVFVERPGPSCDGTYRSMHGRELRDVAPLDRLALGGWCAIAVGDGGNEVGMGSLPPGALDAVPHGAQIACAVPVDHLVLAGTSNWGAAALVAALAAVAPDPAGGRLASLLDDGLARSVLDSMLSAGAVDGITGVAAPTVDGLDADAHQAVPRELRRILAEVLS